MKYEEHLWQLLTSNGNVWHILWQLMAVNATYGNFLSYDKLWQLILMQILPTFDNLWQYLATFGNFCQFLVIYCYLWQLMATYGNFWVRQLSIVSSNFAFFNFHVHFPFSLCMHAIPRMGAVTCSATYNPLPLLLNPPFGRHVGNKQ